MKEFNTKLFIHVTDLAEDAGCNNNYMWVLPMNFMKKAIIKNSLLCPFGVTVFINSTIPTGISSYNAPIPIKAVLMSTL